MDPSNGNPTRDDGRGNSSQKSRVAVDAVHPRFLLRREKPPVEYAVATDDYFCEQCKLMFQGTVEETRRHFQTIPHDPIASCRYCGGEVYEYLAGNKRTYAHDCKPRKSKED